MDEAGLEHVGPNFTGVEKAGPPSMERETDKYINVQCTDKKTLQSSKQTVD